MSTCLCSAIAAITTSRCRIHSLENLIRSKCPQSLSARLTITSMTGPWSLMTRPAGVKARSWSQPAPTGRIAITWQATCCPRAGINTLAPSSSTIWQTVAEANQLVRRREERNHLLCRLNFEQLTRRGFWPFWERNTLGIKWLWRYNYLLSKQRPWRMVGLKDYYENQ